MLTYEDLVNDMAGGCKARTGWRIGIEHEQFVFLKENGLPLPYDGAPGIRQILERFRGDYGWTGEEKDGYLIELRRDGASITLEPGGQVELSGAPHVTLSAMKAEAERYYSELRAIGDALGFGILARGFHPAWTRDDIHWMPKERYRIMGPYMASKSSHGVDMMIRTCGAQINLDFSSEEDMVKKYRVALGLQPVVTALMANSSEVEGRPSGYKSFRSFIWTETDPDRCGVPEFVFEEGMGFARYVDYALDVPMYFIIRNGHYVNVAGKSFRDFMKGELEGHEGEFPGLSDWRDHLTTLFPEVRLKTYLEFRGPDSARAELVYAMAAFWTGIFYDGAALDRAASLIAPLSAKDHVRIRNDVPKDGLATRVDAARDLKDLARDAMAIAADGLRRFEQDALRNLDAFKASLEM